MQDYIEQKIAVIGSLNLETVNTVMNILNDARLTGKRVFICGNGGSAATASHFCCDFNKGVNEGRKPKYDFKCLSDNIPSMMVVANDTNYRGLYIGKTF